MKTRAFIAVNLPEEIKKVLGDFILKLKKLNSRPIKWVKPEIIHLTLHFLGYLDENQLNKVKEILAEITPNYSTFKLQLKEIGGFPNISRPRVIFVNCQDLSLKTLSDYQKDLAKVLEKAGFRVEERPWQMHLTLARLRTPDSINLPKEKILSLTYQIKSVDLMKSELFRQGPRYTILEKFCLK